MVIDTHDWAAKMQPGLPRDPEVGLVRFADMQAIHNIAAIDQSGAHDQPIVLGFRECCRDTGRCMGPQHVRPINVM